MIYEYHYIEIRKPGRLHTVISVPDLAKLIVRWPVQAHGNDRDRDRERDRDRDRNTMIMFRVERGEHLNSSDHEGLGTGNAGLDLYADARLPGAAGLEIEAGIVVRLLHRIAAGSRPRARSAATTATRQRAGQLVFGLTFSYAPNG